jgi:uncharacterized membrane protein
MSWLFFAISAYFIAAIVSIFDKIILTRAIPSSRLYAAWVGIFGIYGLILIPFGFRIQPLIQNPLLVIFSLLSGALFIVGLYFFYSAVKREEISRISPLFGVFVAVFTLAANSVFSMEKLSGMQLLAFFFFLFGTILISARIFDIKALKLKAILFAALGALLIAVSFVLIKFVYFHINFVSAFVAGRIGEVLAGISFLLFARRREFLSIKNYLQSITKRTAGLFVLNKTLAGIFFLLQNYAVFLGSVVLVQALAGTQYAFLLLLTIFLSFRWPALIAEKFSRKTIFIKLIAVLLIGFGFLILVFIQKPADLAPGLRDFGVTFSKHRAKEFGLDWQRTFTAVLDDLGVKKIRLPAYWSSIEKNQGNFLFSDLDWQLTEAERRGAEIILAVGQRLPGWPECHIPDWAWKLSDKERQETLLNFIEQTIKRYRNNPRIKYWQVENEPFLPYFGVCPDFDKKFLDEEIALVRSLDNRPIVVSDSGELSIWALAAKRADIFGTTLYRIVWTDKIPGGAYVHYPVGPDFFYLKANLIKYFAGAKDIIVVELQAEPWGPKPIYEMPISEREKSLSLKQFKENIEFARETGFREAYLWGIEWWYWEKLQGRPEFWEEARALFEDKN